MIIMTPSYISFEKWAIDITRSIPQLIVPIPRDGVKKWWEWVNHFIAVNRLYNLPLGNRTQYPHEDDWRKWANLFIQEVQTINFNQ